jgi:hypothetical protein
MYRCLQPACWQVFVALGNHWFGRLRRDWEVRPLVRLLSLSRGVILTDRPHGPVRSAVDIGRDGAELPIGERPHSIITHWPLL